MAQILKITLTDDLTGGDADETVVFGLDGRTYEIDLSEKNASALRKALERYVAAGRTSAATRPGRRGGASSHKSGAVDPKAVRAWANDQGIAVSARGRIPSVILEKYLSR